MNTYRVNELFYSIQGEGWQSGRPAVFVRFSGCNLNCAWCDTRHSEYWEMSAIEIAEYCRRINCGLVILTGGEPALQIDVELMESLKKTGTEIHVETNGTVGIPAEVRERIDWLVVSPKFGAVLKVRNCDELKVVWSEEWRNEYGSKIPAFKVARKLQSLQACSMQGQREVIEMVKDNPDWMFSFQSHKAVGVR